MGEISLTNGAKIIFIDICECGFTGGCSLCRPITIPSTKWIVSDWNPLQMDGAVTTITIKERTKKEDVWNK
ncbi:MAG: hypothetical protein ACUVUQ_04930 [Thermodesulfovibrionales bacterium]